MMTTPSTASANPALPPIVSVDWLKSDAPADVAICDCRSYLDGRVGRDAYDAGHISGAHHLDLGSDLSAEPGPGIGRHPLPSPESFAHSLSENGIGHDTTVVAYDDAGGKIAGRLVWMLRILGRPAALLDGGIQGWPDELTTNTTDRVPMANSPRPWPASATVDAHQVEVAIADGGLVIDSRDPARYRGEHEPIDRVAGHVPGATNLPLSGNTVDGAFLPLDELTKRFSEARVDADTIYYCGSGVSACNNMLAAEAAGFGRGKLYVGSWSGWSSREEFDQ